MIDAKRWDRVWIVTYSEFGRRASENGSGGTDHGTAAPHFALGGKVTGGLFGKQPDLGSLVRNDLQFTTDYRQLYAMIREDWWKLSEASPFGDYAPIAKLISNS